jgi:ABC-type phosphate/phosphonate transport system substrate-binding protein
VTAERRIASLGMYDAPFLTAANDTLWRAVATRLRAAGVEGVPDPLDRERPLRAIWHDPALLLGATCGYPLVTELGDAVTVVAAPVFDLPGCAGATHRSFIIVPTAAHVASLADLRGARVAINGRDSNTGMNLLRAAVAPLASGAPFFSEVIETGAHLASMAAVARGTADVAAVDCVTFGLAARHRPALVRAVKSIGATPPSPSLPFITRAGAAPDEVALLRRALAEAVASPEAAEAVAALRLRGIAPAEAADYAVLLRYARDAAAASYPELC